MKKLLSLITFSIVFISTTDAQATRYLVKLKHKGGTPFTLSNPSAYLAQRSIDRRNRYGISIDSTDLPSNPSFITQIRNVTNVTVLNVSKWLNAVSIQTTDPAAITTISGFPFVESVTGIAARPAEITVQKWDFLDETPVLTNGRPHQVTADFFNYGTNSYNEIHLHNGEFLHNIGLRGQGMHITMLDGGFFNYTTLKAFDSVNLNGQVLSTWDFVARDASVVEDNAHGMQCFSTIAANIPGQFVGKAPKASFHLFRTEDVATEYVIEEHNWVCGAERADSLGSDLISSSVGYTTFDLPGFDHPYSERNGNIAMASIGADLAAKKGMLVFNAVGNIVDASTQFLSVPSDGDSVVAVGSVNTSGIVASNSSFGPSADGQIKPDVASVGVSAVVQTTSNTIGASSGTSFACPNMAGLTTCLWQGFPEFSNMKIVNAIRQAGSRSSTPDDRMGYGIPNMKAAFGNLLVDFASSTASINNCTASITWTSKDISAMKYEIERKLPGEFTFSKVGELNPQPGILLAIHNYQFDNTVVSPTPGTISYRIRQIIDTAAASFTDVYIDTANVVISAGCFATGTGDPQTTGTQVLVQPNPTRGTMVTLIVVTSYAIPSMTILIMDAKGSMLLQQKSTKGSGRETIELQTGNWPAGKYYVQVFDGVKTVGTAELIKLF